MLQFSKSVAEQLPRRESLRRLGAVFAGAVLSPLGLEAARPGGGSDPCKSFCKCRNKVEQAICLDVCREVCNGDTSRMCGSCGIYHCCGVDQTCCDRHCTDVQFDPFHCGACGYVCDEAAAYETGVCIDGQCEYWCVDGADYCDGVCTPLDRDYENCGACGNVCSGSTPYCNKGVCSRCRPGTAECYSGTCTDIDWDPLNCGGCGIRCSITPSETCYLGVCVETEPCWDCGY